MTLAEFLPTVAHNPKLYLQIIDSDNTSLITFDAASYSAINNTLSSRDIDKITIAEENDLLKIVLKAVPNTIEVPTDDLNGSVLTP